MSLFLGRWNVVMPKGLAFHAISGLRSPVGDMSKVEIEKARILC